MLESFSPDRDREEFARRFEEVTKGFGKRLRGFEPHYEGSPVVAGPPGGVTSAHDEHLFAPRAGHHLAPQPLSSGRSTFDELGEGFTLLAFDAPDDVVELFERAVEAAGVPLTVVRDTRAGGLEGYGCRLVLVRPDQFVCWAGDLAPTDVHALIERVAGRA